MNRIPVYLLAAVFAFQAVGWCGDPISLEDRRFFESQVRPVLATNCLKCHGAKKQRGSLRLDSLEGIQLGGDSGAVVVPGDPESSLLVSAIRHDSIAMPPDEKLSESDIGGLVEWVRRGLPWPGDASRIEPVANRKEKQFDAADRSYWAFQTPRAAGIPSGNSAPSERSPIDRFLNTSRAAVGLEPALPATPRSVARRAFFDLIGLPPSFEELDSFEQCDLPDRYERLLDTLQASPRYGEKWGRHWLDLVRYAESDGYKQDDFRAHAWRYRDYVIRSLNSDKSYRHFVQEQIAGDELAPDNSEALVATGYLRHWTYEYNQRDVRGQWANILNDITDVTADVFLGLGMGCARCHDHKYDPILQRDYYRLQAFFTPFQPRDELFGTTSQERATYQERLSVWESKTATLRARLAEIERPYREKVSAAAIDKFPKDIRPMLTKPPFDRQPLEHQLASLALRQVTLEQVNLKMESKLTEAEKTEWLELTGLLAEFDADRPVSPGQAYMATDVGRESPPTSIPGKPGLLILPGYPTILDPSDASVVPTANTTGRRSALAAWLTSDTNPLTARVMVNRIWQYHFERGLVRTSSDFGRLGEPPTHPELLDWLTCRFQAGGWQFKSLHRMLMTSATYQQQSRVNSPKAQEIDPENRWLWQMPVRRLESEQLRDSLLAASDELHYSSGGPSVDHDAAWRSIFTKVIRNRRDPLIDAFDGVDNFTSSSERNVTTTPTQALILINGPFTLARAEKLAQSLQMAEQDHLVVQELYRRVLARHPSTQEQSVLLPLLATADDRAAAILDLGHVLLNSSEFLYVE